MRSPNTAIAFFAGIGAHASDPEGGRSRARLSSIAPLQGEEETYPLVDYFQTTTYAEKDVEKYLDDYYDELGWASSLVPSGPCVFKLQGKLQRLMPSDHKA